LNLRIEISGRQVGIARVTRIHFPNSVWMRHLSWHETMRTWMNEGAKMGPFVGRRRYAGGSACESNTPSSVKDDRRF
jgi:hypothetical protein